MESKMFSVEVRGDDYDCEYNEWMSECMELLDVFYFDTFEEAKRYCNAITPMKAMEYEKESGYNGLSICIYEQLAKDEYVMVGSYDWIGMYKVGPSVMYECGILDLCSGHEQCGKADSVFEAMALANEIEVEFSGLPIKKWRYDDYKKEWYAASNDEFETPWYIREISVEKASNSNVPYYTMNE